ncbi:glycosyltransferase [Streptomyces sp. VRA16 Mangrove soil]|uniref:glycosyltransferase n=1 Tax=Streptomyces sp. VRA16 Mangrove soil TaxID=2817434 RepID=UPI001A9DB436|nr:glycosyltransferase [Streptomyces sp. VRA16 Mangrove soil]MBO1337579.1 glycosyltransferase family 4 protein [Streptomyces sp. VRA16 Mangrove soil]
MKSLLHRILGPRPAPAPSPAPTPEDTVRSELAAGREPAALGRVLTDLLGRADAAHGRGEHTEAARHAARALELGGHRVLHFDRYSSPLAQDPHGFTEPLRGSAVLRAVAAPRGRSAPAAAPPADRPHRLLLLTRGNANFLPRIRSHFEARPDTEVRFVDLAAPLLRTPMARPERLIEHVLRGSSPPPRELEAGLRPLLDWADTVWVEWCTAAAALVTLLDPGTTRVVVRLHRFETFTQWPHLVDFSRVDDLVFVSGHLRELTESVLPRLTGPGGPRRHVLPNAVALRGFDRPKKDAARFTLALVGIGGPVKDPGWAIEVLRLLRAEDPRYRLLLVGKQGDPDVSAATRRHHDALERELRDPALRDAVHLTGHRDDVAEVLTEVGTLLSSSVCESFHCAVLEGAASGALPVVRDWPFFAGRPQGARTLFPADWVVGSPRAAADRILGATATEEGWRAAGAAAAAYTLGRWDWPVVRESYDRLLGLDPARSAD